MPHEGLTPGAGHSYPAKLGETFHDDAEQRHSYCSLRYDFKPASAGRFRPGAVQVLPDEGRVVVQLPDAANPSADITFSGRYEATRDDLDCVAIFDGSQWCLELVQGLVKTLKTDSRRPSQPSRAGTPPLQPQAGAAEDDGGDVADELEAALEEDTPAAERSASPSPAPGEPTEPLSPPAAQELAARSRQAAADAPPKTAAAHQSASTPWAPPARMEDVPEWEKAFYQAPSDASDDEDLNRCSDDDSDIGREHF